MRYSTKAEKAMICFIWSIFSTISFCWFKAGAAGAGTEIGGPTRQRFLGLLLTTE